MRYVGLFLLSFFFSLAALAQRAGFVTGTVKDMFSEEGLPKVLVEVLRTDSTLVDSVRTAYVQREEVYSHFLVMKKDDKKRGTSFQLRVPDEGNYLLRLSLAGYVTLIQPITVKLGARNRYYDAGELWLGKQRQQLGEATARTTKLKFFNKGDTLVYNADAFQMEESAMLEDLVKRLPGVQLKEGGLYVNGRFVESIQLSGKDFFKGNAKEALQNLPSFVVDQLKFYDKAGELSRTMGTDMGDKSYVMDVTLKREYKSSWVLRPELGIGTHNRYLAWLYGLRFDDRQTLSVNANLNNLNMEMDGMGEEGMGTIMYGDGLRTLRNIKVNYAFEETEKLRFSTNAGLSHNSKRTLNATNSERYLTAGNLYSQRLEAAREDNFKLAGQMGLILRPRKGQSYELNYKADYSNGHTDTEQQSATFNQLPTLNEGEQLLDSIFAPMPSQRWKQHLTNALRLDALRRNHNFVHQLEGKANIAFVPHLLSLSVSARQQREGNEDFSQYDLCYSPQRQASTRDFRNRWDDRQQHNRQLKGAVEYFWKYMRGEASDGQLTPYYDVLLQINTDENPLYRLDRLEQWGSDTHYSLGSLPSLHSDLMKALDVENSLHSTRTTTRHTAGLKWRHKWRLPGRSWLELNTHLALTHDKGRLDYERAGQQYATHRQDWFHNPEVSLSWYPKADDREGKEWTFRLNYNSRGNHPDLNHLMALRKDSDPLNVFTGNPNLSNERTHKAGFLMRRNRTTSHRFQYEVHFDYERYDHAVAMGSIYDRRTGVRTYRPENVEGNQRYVAGASSTFSLWGHSITLQAESSQNHSVDLNAITAMDSAERSHIDTREHSLELSTMKQKDLWYVYASLGSMWKRAVGTRPDFTPIAVQHYNASLYCGRQKVLWGVSVSNNLYVVLPQGYSDPSLNRLSVNWGLSLSKSFLNDRLNVRLSGKDLLRMRNNNYVQLDAQGRTEYVNLLFQPSHILLSVGYRLVKKPKAQ